MSAPKRSQLALPERVEVIGIEDTVNSLREKAARRDTLLQMAEQATREAAQIDKELRAEIMDFHKQLRMQKAELLSE